MSFNYAEILEQIDVHDFVGLSPHHERAAALQWADETQADLGIENLPGDLYAALAAVHLISQGVAT